MPQLPRDALLEVQVNALTYSLATQPPYHTSLSSSSSDSDSDPATNNPGNPGSVMPVWNRNRNRGLVDSDSDDSFCMVEGGVPASAVGSENETESEYEESEEEEDDNNNPNNPNNPDVSSEIVITQTDTDVNGGILSSSVVVAERERDDLKSCTHVYLDEQTRCIYHSSYFNITPVSLLSNNPNNPNNPNSPNVLQGYIKEDMTYRAQEFASLSLSFNLTNNPSSPDNPDSPDNSNYWLEQLSSNLLNLIVNISQMIIKTETLFYQCPDDYTDKGEGSENKHIDQNNELLSCPSLVYLRLYYTSVLTISQQDLADCFHASLEKALFKHLELQEFPPKQIEGKIKMKRWPVSLVRVSGIGLPSQQVAAPLIMQGLFRADREPTY